MIKREMYMKQIRPFMNNDLVKVLTGIRRSGKSVMLDLIKQELLSSGISDSQFLTINFETMSNARYCTAQSLHDRIEEFFSSAEGRTYLFFDEIQEVKDWERCINSCRTEYDCDIYITGSNAKLLSGELATYLAGRYVEFVIYPFSFTEFLEVSRLREPSIDVSLAFRNYILTGGMPFLANLLGNSDACTQYLKDIYNSVVLKDVVRRNSIRDVNLLERTITYMLANVGHSFSANSLSKYFKSENRSISHETILNYIKACTDAFLFYKISREDLIGKKILSVNEKYYVADHGLREAVYGSNNRDMDQVLENIVCLELLRRGYHVSVGKTNTKEIDFVSVKNGQRLYIQVSYLLASEETIEREFGAYKNIADNYPKYVLSMDEFDMSRNGIKHFHVRDFLLMKEWN
ncbi:MAG: ATP-binding protein [Lachnospiraceae bacterium]|nr:ATP-binding protein [Lachnospiraceae bacterium]